MQRGWWQCGSGRLRIPLFVAVAIASVQAQSGIQALVSAGTINGMRWPNFPDVQSSVREFYEPTGYVPAWLQGARPSPQAIALIQILEDSSKKGLEPEDYDASKWNARVQSLEDSPANSAVFDVALTVCTMRYISALRVGRIDPRHFKFNLSIKEKKYDLAEFVRGRLVSATDVSAMLSPVEPPFEGYRHTELALARYVEFARNDDGEKFPAVQKPINPGDDYAGVPRLVRLLRLVGDLSNESALPAATQRYDGALVEAVKRFQLRHGLDDDGRIGPATVQQLNVPLSDRVRQLQIALERWRWLPERFPAPPIIVNIPDFRLRALDENNKVALAMRVVVGKAMRTQTPVFSRDMTYIVLRPYWNVPPSILRGEIVPAIQRDRSYIMKKGYEVTTFDGKVITSGAISDDILAQLKAGKLTVRQKPGPSNALGLVKLMFPNEYNVYLHSTPAPELFSRSRRDFSHGCIRVEKPAELTAWVSRNNPGWTLERIQKGMQSGPNDVTVKLVEPVPVFIVYGTAIAYQNDEVHFFDDIYGHDAKLIAALAKGYPYPQ